MSIETLTPGIELLGAIAERRPLQLVQRTITRAGETGLSLYQRLAGLETAFLFESLGAHGVPQGPAILGVTPLVSLRAEGRRVTLTLEQARHTLEADPIEVLRTVLGAVTPDEAPALSRYLGAMGYFGYDTVRHIERLPQVAAAGLPLPEALWIVPSAFVLLTPETGELTLVGLALPREREALATARHRAEAALAELQTRLDAPRPAAVPAPGGNAPEFTAMMTAEEFIARVASLKEHIRAGDIFQAVLSQRFETRTPASPEAIYEVLRTINPSPYMYLLRFAEATIVGASPELLVRVRDREIGVRPIAGTRPRGRTPEEDAALEAALKADPKELAEHVMLVDLGRNDVGRVAALGSVRVADRMVIERYSHVMHLVSGVSGSLADGLDAFDAFRATFPAGTLSGAPKIKAMSLLETHEPVRRGLYGGAVGYFGFNGDADLAIAIRTLVALGERKVFQTGAGIVYDSDPQREHQETLDKARALRAAITRAHTGQMEA